MKKKIEKTLSEIISEAIENATKDHHNKEIIMGDHHVDLNKKITNDDIYKNRAFGSESKNL